MHVFFESFRDLLYRLDSKKTFEIKSRVIILFIKHWRIASTLHKLKHSYKPKHAFFRITNAAISGDLISRGI